MTKSELRSRTKQALGNRTGGSYTDDWYDERVLNGYRRLLTFQGPVQASGRTRPQSRVLRFPQHENRRTNTLESSLTKNFVQNAAGVLLVTDVYDRTNNVGLTAVSERDILSRDPDELGQPTMWCPGATDGVMGYWIWPRPGSASEEIDVYEYTVTAPAMATEGTSPLIDPEWHMAVVYAAAAEGADLMDWVDKRNEMNQRFQESVMERTTLLERASFGGRTGRRRNVTVGGW